MGQITRLPHWQSKFCYFLRENESREFSYGTWDCCLFTCDGVQAITGTDLAADFRGKYKTEKSALRLIKKTTGSVLVESIAAHVTSKFEIPEIPVLRAGRGDVVLIDNKLLGLVHLNGHEAVTLSPEGIWRVPMSRATQAWKI